MLNNNGKKKSEDSANDNRSLAEAIDALKKEGILLDIYSQQDDEYEVETVLKASDQEWFFSSVAKLNGKEITDNIELARESFQRERVTQASKSKALWNLFVKGAAEIHLQKCHAVKRRNQKPDTNLLHNNKRLFTSLGVLIIVGTGTAIIMLNPTSSPVNQTAQKNAEIAKALAEPAMPSNPDLVGLKIIEPVVRPSMDQLAPKSEAAPIPEKEVEATDESDGQLVSESQNEPSIKADSQTTQKLDGAQKAQATPAPESEAPPALAPAKPMAPESPEPEVQAARKKPAPTTEVQPTPAEEETSSPEPAAPALTESQAPEDTDAGDSLANEADLQQSSTTLSQEEIRQKVKMLLKTTK